jgi:hypothetical protein
MKEKLSKRVTISYSVELSEVPARSALMLDELSSIFRNLSIAATEAAQETRQNALKGLKKLNKISFLLDKTKIRVEDISLITSDYVEALKEIAESEEKKKKRSSKDE